jgi:ferric-dicitrate binding protein FerR (iron transport regulator)
LKQEIFIDLVIDYLTGQINEEQLEVLKNQLLSAPCSKQQFEEMREIWMATMQTVFDKETAFRMFLARINNKKEAHRPQRRHIHFTRWMRAAAAIVIGFMGGLLSLYFYNNAMPAQPVSVAQIETVVPLGSKSRVTLTDGTSIWLNAGSRLCYMSDFGQTGREVYLEGEGYFDVAHDPAKIFVVKTDKIDIKALGTSFNVKAYPDEEIIETVLVEGKVSFGETILKPREKGVYMRKNATLLVQKKAEEQSAPDRRGAAAPGMPGVKIVEIPLDPVIYTSWKDSLWKIERETLDDMAVKLERRYNVNIQFKDPAIGQLSVTATIKDESLEQVLRFLQLSVPIDFYIDGKTVTLQENSYLKEKYKAHYKI